MAAMKRMVEVAAVVALLMALPAWGQETLKERKQIPQGVAPEEVAATPYGQADYMLGPGDQLKIFVLGLEEIAASPIRIDSQGNLDCPLLGNIQVRGKTVEGLRQELMKLAEKEVLKPRVSVEIVEYGSQPVSIVGAVTTPGVRQIQGRKTLIEVLSMAGGLRPDAGYSLRISRRIENGPIPLSNAKTDTTGKYSMAEVPVKELMGAAHPDLNISIAPHDVITVPTADVIYVLGSVKKAGGFPLHERENLSVLQALALAEGMLPMEAAPDRARILRTVQGESQRQEIAVNLKKVLSGEAEDIVMRSNDVLYVPMSTGKVAALRAVEAAFQIGTGVLIWRRF